MKKINTNWENYNTLGKILYVLQIILIIAILYIFLPNLLQHFIRIYALLCFGLLSHIFHMKKIKAIS